MSENKKPKIDDLKKVSAGLGISLVIMSGGFVGTHEKINDKWLTNEDYDILKNQLIEKQEKNSYITLQEWQTLSEIYDKEVKRGIGKKDYKDLKADQLVEKFNKDFKNK